MKSRLVLFSLFIALLISSPAFAQEGAQKGDTVVLSDGQNKYSVGLHMEILRDPSGELTIQDVTSAAYQDQFTLSQAETPNFGFQKAAYWVRFRILNQAKQNSSWVLELEFVNMHYVDLYLPTASGSSYQVKQSGMMRPFNSRDIPFRLLAFNLDVPPGNEQTVYLRFQSEASMTLPLVLWSRNAFTGYMLLDQLNNGLLTGALIIMALYNLMLWLLIRERSYLYLVLFIASNLGTSIFYRGIGVQFFHFSSPRVATSLLLVFLGLEIFFVLIFFTELLDLKTNSPKLHRGSHFFSGALILTILLAPFGSYQLIGVTQLILGVMIFTAIAVVVLYYLWAGSRLARFLLVSWIFFIFAGILLAFTRMGLLSSTPFSENFTQVGMVWMVAVWSLALADRVNTLKAEAETTSRQLKTSENHMTQFLDAMPVGVVVFGTDLEPRYINREVQRLLTDPSKGVFPDFSLQRTLEETRDYFSFRITGTDQPYPLEQLLAVRAMRERQSASAEDVEIGLGDQRIPIEAWASPLFDTSGDVSGAVVAFRDIHERLQREAELRESLDMRRLALEGGRLGIWSIDLVHEDISLDARTREIFGLADDEPVTLELVFSLIHPEDRGRIQESFERHLDPQSDGTIEGEMRIVQPNGSISWVSARGDTVFGGQGAKRRAIRLVGIVMDMTQRKEAEQALEMSVARFRKLVETMNEGLGVLDEHGTFTYVNPRLAEMLGYTPDEMLGRSGMDFFDQPNRAIVADQLVRRRLGEQGSYQITWCRKDGCDLHTLVTPAAVFDQDGKFVHSIAVVTDISEQVRVQQLLDQRVAERTHELETLLEVSQVMVSTLELEPLLQLILDQLNSVVDFSGAVIYSMADRHLSTRNFPLLVEKEKAMHMAMTLMQELSQDERLLHSEAIFITDLQADTEDGLFLRHTAAGFLDINSSQMRSWMGIPLKFKDHFIGVLSVYHNQVDYYTAKDARLAFAFANQAAVAIENARLYRQAQAVAASKERGRLARELHDSVTQALYSLTLYAGATRAALHAGKLEAAEKNLEEVVAVAREGMGDLRLLIFELRPPILDEEGLVGALQVRLEAVERRAGIKTEFYAQGEPDLSNEIEKELYWSVHEALNNVLKHARAKNVSLNLHFQNGSAAITLQDDGVGFDASRFDRSNGMGLKNVTDRIQKLGGSLKIESNPGEGTIFHIKLEH